MVFDKKFKNYLNHRQEFMEKAKRRREAIIEKRKQEKEGNANADDYFNEEEILSNNDRDYIFENASDMKVFLNELKTGQRKKRGVQLFHAEKFEYEFRMNEFSYLLTLASESES